MLESANKLPQWGKDSQLNDIRNKYRDLTASGRVYIIQYENAGTNHTGLSIKFGYTSKSVQERMDNYNCADIKIKMALAVFPSEEEENQLPGAHLLEEILHAIFVARQRDRSCPCNGNEVKPRTHGEIFEFEKVKGENEERAAAQIRVHDLEPSFREWTDLLRNDVVSRAFLQAQEAYKMFTSIGKHRR
ncbi:hypothetical protein BG004_000721 [Podila humilis]|nr:hypothetical protein BG004_000721 [Podila humilis]